MWLSDFKPTNTNVGLQSCSRSHINYLWYFLVSQRNSMNCSSLTVLLIFPDRNLVLIREHKNKRDKLIDGNFLTGLSVSGIDEFNLTKVSLNPPALKRYIVIFIN